MVLIVDDIPDNLAVLHDALEEAGYAVRVATDGLGALESVRRSPPDIIVLDAMMPGVDGFETCRLFQREPRLGHRRVSGLRLVSVLRYGRCGLWTAPGGDVVAVY